MLTIANPIYDTVFKYLMEDLDIAKGLISTIIDREIIEIAIQPQETMVEMDNSIEKPLRVYRIDFAAIVKEADGTTKKVLIELQKTKRSTNILRFRRYLAEGYQKEDSIVENDEIIKTSLEIITIYFLGFELSEVPTPVLHVKNTFIDVTTGFELPNAPKSDFVRLLNHESYTIQITRLAAQTQSQLERVLSVFNQNYKTKDAHILLIPEENANNPLYQKMTQRLLRAIASEEIRRKMDLEDDLERDYQDVNTKFEKAKLIIEEKEQKIKEKEQKIKDKDKKLAEKEQKIEEKDKKIEEKDKKIEEKDKKIEEKDKNIEEKEHQLAEQQRIIAELMKKLNLE